jgi:putative transposase
MSSHRAYQLYAHITWHTWNRVGCLDQAAVAAVQSAVSSACRKSAVRVLRGAVLADHVHLVVSFRPDSRLSDFVRLVKSVAAVRANRRVPGAVRWARGFYAATLHQRDLPRVIRYVARQFDRHRDKIPKQTDPGRQPGVEPKTRPL